MPIDIRNYFAPSIGPPGLQIHVDSGILLINGGGMLVSAVAVALPANSTSYVYLDTSLAGIYNNTSGFPASNCYPIAIVITSTSGVVSCVDQRPDVSPSAAGGPAVNFSLNGTSSSVSLVAGNNITLNSGASSISLVGPSPATQSLSGGGVSVTGTAVSFDIEAGSNITLASATAPGALTLSINGVATNTVGTVLTVIAAGTAPGQWSNGFTAGTLNTASSTGFSLVAGNYISLYQASTSPNILIVGMDVLGGAGISVNTTRTQNTRSGPAFSIVNTYVQSLSGGGTGVTGGAVSLDIEAGSNISLASATGAGALTLTINASVQTASVSMSALGNTTSSSTGTFSNALAFSGAGGASVGVGAGSVTISAPVPGLSSLQISSGNTAGATTNITSGGLTLVGGNNITLSQSLQVVTISGPAVPTATNFSLNGSSSSVSLVNGTGVSFASNASTITIAAALAAGTGVSISTGAGGPIATILTTGNRISLTQNISLGEVAGTITSASGTVTGTAGFGSSLFLQRIFLPSAMNLSEIDIAMSIGFNATSNGAGTVSRSFVLYSLGNSTSLASVVSASGTSAWTTGTSTAGASGSLTQFQGGWSSPLIQPMTFASSSVPAGDYVVGQLINFAQASSTWTVNLYGGNANNTAQIAAATNLTSASLGALSSGGLAGVSAHTASSSSAITAFSGAPGGLQVISGSGGLLVGHLLTGAAFNQVFTAMGTSAIGALVGSGATSTSYTSSTQSVGTNDTVSQIAVFTTAPTILSSIIGATTFSQVSAYSTTATASAMKNSATSAYGGFLGSGGLSAGSFIGTSGSINAVTNVALGALASSTVAATALPNFGFIGTGSTTSGFPTAFIAGIMSTGAVPTSIAITSNAVTYSGSFAFIQPWFALAGA